MKILLVCNDKDLSNEIVKKLVFLRKDDVICKSDYTNAVNDIAIKSPDIILLYEDTFDETIYLIQSIRKNTQTSVILISRTGEQDMILSAYDVGINDFVHASILDYELVLRIINNIKYCSLKQNFERYAQMLEQLKVLDSLTGIYNYDYAKQAIENYLDKNIINDGSFMVLSPSQESKTYFSSEKLAASIKLVIRENDIVTKGKGVNYYIFMPYTDMNGAVTILNRIKEEIDFSVCAGISEISDKSFTKFEQNALKAHSEALTLGTDFKFAEVVQEETLDDWLVDKSSKDYKIFRQMFNKKLEKVITPVFFRLQKTYEEKLFNTNIEQYVTDEQCVFNLKNKKGNSYLKIIYPGFAKITVLITHEGLDSPENKEIKLPLAKITQKELVEIVEDFIKEYKTNVIDR